MRIPKRFFFSLLIVLLWLGFVVDGTHALFSASATLAGSTINSGSANLLVSNSQNGSSSLFETTRPGFSFTLVPGETDQRYIFLKNVATGVVDFDLSLTASVKDGTNIGDKVTIGIFPVDDTGLATQAGYTGTIADLQAARGTGLILPSDSTQRYVLKVTLSPSVTEQNQSMVFDLTFTGTQHIPEPS